MRARAQARANPGADPKTDYWTGEPLTYPSNSYYQQQQLNKSKQEQIDSNFFAGMSLGAHVKSKKKLEGRLSDKSNKRKLKTKKIYAELDPKRHGHE